MRKVIVTGANGFIGSALCKTLSDMAIEVIAVIKNKDEKIDMFIGLPYIRIVYCELSEFSELDKLIQDRDVDVFYHFAWVGSAGFLRGDVETQMNNIRYTLDALFASKKINCKKFVFAASIMEYEIHATIQTTNKTNISSLYSVAKLSADYMARVLSEQLEIIYLRCVISNVYGPGEKSPRLINTSLRKMMKGEHCAFSTGKQMYDFIYITDAAKIFIEIGEKGVANRTYYIGSQSPKQLKDFLLEMREQVDPNLEIGLGELSFNDISLTYNEFDIRAVEDDTGYIPEVSFSEGIRKTLNWIKEDF